MARQSRHCQEIWEVIYLLILFDILKLGGVIACNTESATGSSDNWSGERRCQFLDWWGTLWLSLNVGFQHAKARNRVGP